MDRKTLVDRLTTFADDNQLTFGPNKNAMVSAIIKKGGYCPCRTGKKAENLCPCSFALDDVRRDGHCKCRLFFRDGKKRTAESDLTEYTTTLNALLEKTYPRMTQATGKSPAESLLLQRVNVKLIEAMLILEEGRNRYEFIETMDSDQVRVCIDIMEKAKETESFSDLFHDALEEYGEKGLHAVIGLAASNTLEYRLYNSADAGSILRMRLIAADPDVRKLIVKGKTTIIDFFAEWCEPCKALGKDLEKLTKTRKDVTVQRIDIDKETDIAERCRIDSVPFVAVFGTDGKAQTTMAGYGGKGSLNTLIKY